VNRSVYCLWKSVHCLKRRKWLNGARVLVGGAAALQVAELSIKIYQENVATLSKFFGDDLENVAPKFPTDQADYSFYLKVTKT
jgi:hypothetical protein